MAVDDLVLSIYRAAETPLAWNECLERIRIALNGTGISLMHHDAAVVQRSVAAYRGFDDDSFDRYRQYYHRIDPWGLALQRLDLTSGRIIDGRSVVSPDEVKRGEYYTDFGRQIGSAQSLFGAIESEENRTALIIIARSFEQPEFDAADQLLLQQIMPHLRQAFRLHRRITGAEGLRATSCEALDRLAIGVVLVDRRGRPIFVNAAAYRLAACRDGLVIERDIVRAADAVSARRLAAAIARAIGPVGEVCVSDGESAFIIEGKTTGTAFRTVVLPVGRSEDALGFEVGAAAAIFIGDPDQQSIDGPSRLVALFGLTAGEARVALRIANGESLTDIAATLNLTVGTVRWYAKQILQKAGVSTQAQFVSLVLRGPAGVRGDARCGSRSLTPADPSSGPASVDH
jgi:DNA-binding CsgD family transcriptional regulator